MGRAFYHFTRACVATLLLAVPLTGEPVKHPSSPSESFRSKLEYRKASYTSIFGLVPKECALELSEERLIVREQDSSRESILLKPVSSSVRRVLRVPDEIPILETNPKPLTGKVVQLTRTGDSWKPEIIGLDQPTPSEAREADRLAARFSPGASPFEHLKPAFSEEVKLDMSKLLTFLGYAGAKDVYGQAILRPKSSDPSSTTEGAYVLELNTLFNFGELSDRISVEIEAKGDLLKPASQPDFVSLELKGNLALHGERDLPDGRRVPFNIVADFVYEAERLQSGGNEGASSIDSSVEGAPKEEN